MLIALGRGDKYRLTHIRETLERGKELYISDKDFLENLVKSHLKDKIYQARIVSISEKPNLFLSKNVVRKFLPMKSFVPAAERKSRNLKQSKKMNQ